jgi:hypothetical protein
MSDPTSGNMRLVDHCAPLVERRSVTGALGRTQDAAQVINPTQGRQITAAPPSVDARNLRCAPDGMRA